MYYFSCRPFHYHICLILIVLFIPAQLNSQITEQSDYTLLNPQEFMIQLNLEQNEVLLDVRSFDEFKKERLPNSLLASNSGQLFSILDTLDIEQPVFIYCEEENRSAVACNYAHKMGFEQIYMLEGGIVNWKKHNLKVDRTKIRRKK